LKNMDSTIYWVEILREVATMLMLICVSALTAENFISWFAYFLFNFAVWDIFYYVWLKVLLNWPASLMEWDILFLIPITWDGPVLSPLLCTLAMLSLASVILVYHYHGKRVTLLPKEWALLASGALLILSSFMWNYTHFMLENGFFHDLANLSRNPDFLQALETFAPSHFQWPLFLSGYGLIWIAIFCLLKRLHTQED